MKPTLFISDLHLSAARPALVDAFERFCAGPAREAARAVRAGRPVRHLDRRRPAARPDGRAASPRRCAGVAAAGVGGRRDARQPRLPARRRGSPRRPARRCCRTRSSSTSPARRRCCCTATSCAPTTSPTSGTAACVHDPVRQRRFLALPYVAPSRDRRAGMRGKSRRATAAQARDDHGRQCRRGRGGFRAARRRADDPRPHAPAGAPRARRRRRACERWVLARLVRPRRLPRGRRGGARARRRIAVRRASPPVATRRVSRQRLREIGDSGRRGPRCRPRRGSASRRCPSRPGAAAPISQKIVCATGIASVRLSPRFDDDTTIASRFSTSKQSTPSTSSNESSPPKPRNSAFARACCGCAGSPG